MPAFPVCHRPLGVKVQKVWDVPGQLWQQQEGRLSLEGLAQEWGHERTLAKGVIALKLLSH